MLALLPGDPGRVPRIAEALGGGEELAWKREYRTWRAEVRGRPLLITSTGIGGPSTAIAVEELAMLGVRIFVRVGTSGAIQDFLAPGDVVVTQAAIRWDGASRHYAPLEFPAAADPQLALLLLEAGKETGVRTFLGVTCSSDTFYPGQERYDSYSGYVLRSLQGSLAEWRRLRVLNYEMEAATLFVQGLVLGLRCAAACGIAVVRGLREEVTLEEVRRAEENAIRVVAAALRRDAFWEPRPPGAGNYNKKEG